MKNKISPHSARGRVSQALEDLCSEAPRPGGVLFRVGFTARQVADRAGVRETTAKLHLDDLLLCQRFSSTKRGNCTLFRCEAETADT